MWYYEYYDMKYYDMEDSDVADSLFWFLPALINYLRYYAYHYGIYNYKDDYGDYVDLRAKSAELDKLYNACRDVEEASRYGRNTCPLQLGRTALATFLNSYIKYFNLYPCSGDLEKKINIVTSHPSFAQYDVFDGVEYIKCDKEHLRDIMHKLRQVGNKELHPEIYVRNSIGLDLNETKNSVLDWLSELAKAYVKDCGLDSSLDSVYGRWVDDVWLRWDYLPNMFLPIQ